MGREHSATGQWARRRVTVSGGKYKEIQAVSAKSCVARRLAYLSSPDVSNIGIWASS
jgi:hypothetical protein